MARNAGLPAAAGLALVLVAGAAGAAPVAAGPHGDPAGPHAAVADGDSARSSVIVRGTTGDSAQVRAAVAAAGGSVTRALGLVDGVVADVPTAAVGALRGAAGVLAVTPDAPLTLSDTPADVPSSPSSLADVAAVVGARPQDGSAPTGRGVDVALLDSGVVPVEGLRAPGKVVDGPDLSFDSGNRQTRHLDGYGHGTHMAGIIAGRDEADPQVGDLSGTGIAPDARLVNVKVADSGGATDVSQVIAGLDWVVAHRRDGDLDVRVVNLSFGTDGVQDHQLDPLAHAVERAWRAGIVVVVAAGNEGFGSAKLDNPAYDPYVLAVGGSDGRGTAGADDDVVAPWSSRGDAQRHPDLVAPGQSVVSLRSPGSSLDVQHPGARTGSRFFRGSGTSQATAVVSGAVALLLQQRPELTPDQVKALLMGAARPLPLGDALGQGAGLLDVRAALTAPTPTDATQTWPRARGTGSLDLARGSVRVSLDGVPLVGQQTVFRTGWSLFGTLSSLLGGSPWSGGGWTGTSWTGNSWTGGAWQGNSWTGNSWTGNSWTGNSWTGNSWTGNSWTGNSWTTAAW